MNQEPLPFFETAEAATKHAIATSGMPPKAVAHRVFPDKTPDAAYTLLMNALNENRNERLTADQHILVANITKRFYWLYYAAMRCQHSQPQLITPAAQQARLQETLFAKADELQVVLQQISDLKASLQA